MSARKRKRKVQFQVPKRVKRVGCAETETRSRGRSPLLVTRAARLINVRQKALRNLSLFLFLPYQTPPRRRCSSTPLPFDQVTASSQARAVSITSCSRTATLQVGSTWKGHDSQFQGSSQQPSNHHDLFSDWLLPQHCTRSSSPGSSSSGTSFVESSPSDLSLAFAAAPTPTSSLPVLSSVDYLGADGETYDDQFTSSIQQLLALGDGTCWNEATSLSDFQLPKANSLPVSRDFDQSTRRNFLQSDFDQFFDLDVNNSLITWSETTATDPHLAFFSHDANFGPVAEAIETQPREKTDASTDANSTTENITSSLQRPQLQPDYFSGDSFSFPPVTTDSFTTAQPRQTQFQIHSQPISLSSTSTPLTKSKSISPSPTPASASASSPSSSKPPNNNNTKITKEFHFVPNSDKAAAARVRNTMASRKHRQSKVNRIAELERLLATMEEERDTWKERALDSGWSE